MRKYRTYLKEMMQTDLIETTCDLCGAVAKRGEWGSATWEVAETEIKITIRQKDGEAYPDSGDGTEYNVDMCPKCFKEKLIPWLTSQNATCERKAWDW